MNTISTEVDYSAIIDILEDIFGDFTNHNDHKGQISFSCPVCSYDIKGLDHLDGKGNLEINYIQNVYKCWVCSETHETHGSLFKLIKKYGTKKHIKKYELLMPEDVVEIKRVYKKLKLPKEFISLSNASLGVKLLPHYKQAINYLKSRKVSDEMILRYNIGFAYDGKYAGRIIIPSYDNDKELNYFIARSYYSKTKRKYLNPEAQKEIIVFNEYLIDWTKPISLVEGAFDSIFVINSIPMLGKFMSEHLFSLLYEKAVEIIIILDGDAWADAVKLYHKLNNGRLFGKIKITKLPLDMDIADLEGDLTKLNITTLD